MQQFIQYNQQQAQEAYKVKSVKILKQANINLIIMDL